MGITLSINKEEFSKDSKGRHVTTLTAIYFNTVSLDKLDVFQELVNETEEDDTNFREVPFQKGTSDLITFEVHGDLLKAFVEAPTIDIKLDLAEDEVIDEEGLYEVEFSF